MVAALRKEAAHLRVVLQIVVEDTVQADHVLHTEIQTMAAHAVTSHDHVSEEVLVAAHKEVSHVLALVTEAEESVDTRKCQSTFLNS
jgi:hypothetical protein